MSDNPAILLGIAMVAVILGVPVLIMELYHQYQLRRRSKNQ